MFKNVFRLFLKKKFQLIAIGIVILFSSLLYTSMYIAMNSVEKSIKNLSEDYNQEDFTIELVDYVLSGELKNNDEIISLENLKNVNEGEYKTIINERINNLLSEYPEIDLELRESKDVEFKLNKKTVTMRALKDSKKINRTMIEKGRVPETENEVALPEIFAKKNNLKIGSKLNISGFNYTIVGYCLVPDYTLLMFGNDFNIDNANITLGVFTDKGYEKITAKEKYNLSGVYNNVNKKDLNSNKFDYILSIKNTETNMNSGYIYTEIQMGKEMIMGLSILISSIAIIIVSILVYKFIQIEKSQIGVLKALGYNNKEICRPYLILISVISLPMLVIGSILGGYLSKPIINIFNKFYLFPRSSVGFDIKVYLMSVIVPFIFFITFSYLVIRIILKKKPLELLKYKISDKVSIITKILDKLLSKCKTTTKFKYSFLLKSKGKFIVFVLGFIFASVLIITALMIPGFYYKLSIEPYKLVDYRYEAYVDQTKEVPELKENEEKNIIMNSEYKDKTITLKGLEIDNKLYKLYDENKVEISDKLKEGVIISNSFKSIFNKDVGDIITITINNKVQKLKIVGVSKEYGDFTIYFNIEDLSKLFNNGSNKVIYTGIYSKEKIDEDSYSYVIDKNDIVEQSKSMQTFLYISLGGILVFSIMISGIILFVLTSLTVEDSYYNISLLKVIGYNKKEINSMILNSYLGYGIISFLISIPITSIGIGYFMESLGKKFDMAIPFNFEWWQGILGLVIIVGIYYLGSISSKNKIKKIELQAVLKEYNE